MLKVSWWAGAALCAAALGLAACGGRTISSAASDGGQTGGAGGFGGATGGFGGAMGGFGGAMGGFGGAMGGFGGAMGGFGGATGGTGGVPLCPPGFLQCGDLCVDAQIDPSNCGSCGHACNPQEVCFQGVCTSPCGPGTLCGSFCTDLQTDPSNCGFCGNVCGPNETCAAAVCVPFCGPGTIPCGSGCVDPTKDPNNCGACGIACPQGQPCLNGACTASGCTNIAPQATGSTSPGGGSTPPYTAEQLNNGLNNAQCNQGWSWASSGGSPYFELAWPSAVTIGSIFIDAEKAAGNPACNVPSGRDIKSASVQYWNGSTWVTVAAIQNQENYSVTFPTKITTTKLRVAGVTTSPGNGNPIIYEWYVFSAMGCPAPPGT